MSYFGPDRHEESLLGRVIPCSRLRGCGEWSSPPSVYRGILFSRSKDDDV